MTQLLQRLAEEHGRLMRLLDLLEGLLDQFHAGEHPDYELMCELMEYLIDYSDQIHHPSEELIFERLLTRSDEDHDVLRRLQQQHAALSQVNRRFKESLEGIVHEEVLCREDVEQNGRQLLATLREHMRLEDQVAFPLAQRCLSDADWTEIEAVAPQMTDPIFGHADPERFRAIYARLQSDCWDVDCRG
jgi:hemerythrin-like domain-containing protein